MYEIKMWVIKKYDKSFTLSRFYNNYTSFDLNKAIYEMKEM